MREHRVPEPLLLDDEELIRRTAQNRGEPLVWMGETKHQTRDDKCRPMPDAERNLVESSRRN